MASAKSTSSLAEKWLLAIDSRTYLDERELLTSQLPDVEEIELHDDVIIPAARKLVDVIREMSASHGLEQWMAQFGLSSHEGVTIMCLAESLLRIPDSHTADRLIHDKLKDTQWEGYVGQSDSLFVNASMWGLALTGGIVGLPKDDGNITSRLNSMVSRLGEPIIRNALKAAMKMLGSYFVVGQTVDEACLAGHELRVDGYTMSYDMLGEGARSWEQAEIYFERYLEAIAMIGLQSNETEIFERPGVSIKLSALHPDFHWLNRENVRETLLPKLRHLVAEAKKHRMLVAIDAEEVSRLDLSLWLYDALLDDRELCDFGDHGDDMHVCGVGLVVQAYQTRSRAVLDWLYERAQELQLKLPIRLVKGAYWDTEIHNAQLHGLESYPVYTKKHHTDMSFLACASFLLRESNYFYPQFATHNAYSIAAIAKIAGDKSFEFQRLYGMGQAVYDHLVERHRVRVYAPVGQTKELLPYLIRRLIENGANSSFVNQVLQKDADIAALVRSPIEQFRHEGNQGEAAELKNPREILSHNRINSFGIDTGNASELSRLLEMREIYRDSYESVSSIIAGDYPDGERQESINPARRKQAVGEARLCKAVDVTQAIDIAYESFAVWSQLEPVTRGDILRKAADMLQQRQAEFIALLQQEAGKTLQDAIDEIREAIDFCRYYAQQAEDILSQIITLDHIEGERNLLSYAPKGVFACISPWNFPLAIFLGQIAAALAAGNTVVAKPASQTPVIAYKAVELLHQAGVPTDVLHLVIGRASEVGPALCEDVRVCGVVFTGSGATASRIHRALASRKEGSAIASLVAETGGINAMIVDSTALLEQTVDAVIHSAFGSAGQRCSALRVLCVQDDIAPELIALLQGAMEHIQLGDPWQEAVSVGPVIDHAAKKTIEAYIRKWDHKERVLYKHTKPKGLSANFIAPTLIELDKLSELTDEVFGPVLHIVRYSAKDADVVIQQMNDLHFGLTFGIQSRIEQRYDRLAHTARMGNIYVNRSMTGAVVGMQPFGGMGLSGTGPKAGGPNYIRHFVVEKTVSTNLAAIGGDVSLWQMKS